jgi:hypothetical protein
MWVGRWAQKKAPRPIPMQGSAHGKQGAFMCTLYMVMTVAECN